MARQSLWYRDSSGKMHKMQPGQSAPAGAEVWDMNTGKRVDPTTTQPGQPSDDYSHQYDGLMKQYQQLQQQIMQMMQRDPWEGFFDRLEQFNRSNKKEPKFDWTSSIFRPYTGAGFGYGRYSSYDPYNMLFGGMMGHSPYNY